MSGSSSGEGWVWVSRRPHATRCGHPRGSAGDVSREEGSRRTRPSECFQKLLQLIISGCRRAAGSEEEDPSIHFLSQLYPALRVEAGAGGCRDSPTWVHVLKSANQFLLCNEANFCRQLQPRGSTCSTGPNSHLNSDLIRATVAHIHSSYIHARTHPIILTPNLASPNAAKLCYSSHHSPLRATLQEHASNHLPESLPVCPNEHYLCVLKAAERSRGRTNLIRAT